MDSLFEFLFKFRPIVFEQGDFAFAAPSDVRTWLGIAGVIGASAVATYTIARGKSTILDRGVMAGLRVALLAVLVFCLMQPALTLSTVVPQQNFVGVLLDDSRSMLLQDEGGESPTPSRPSRANCWRTSPSASCCGSSGSPTWRAGWTTSPR
jgi:hypothetical protein